MNNVNSVKRELKIKMIRFLHFYM